MRNRKMALLAAAALAALPVAAHAVTIAYTIDPNDFTVSLTGPTGTYVSLATAGGVLTGTGAAESLTLPAGSYLRFGVDGTMTGTTAGTGATTPASAIGQMSFGINDSNQSVASVYASAASNASGTSVPTSAGTGGIFSLSAKGQADGVGGIKATFGVTVGQSGGAPASFTAGNGATVEASRQTPIGVTGGAGTSATFTILPYFAGTQYITGSSSAYQFDFLGTGDSVTGSTLKITVAGVATTSSSSSSTHPIISLTAGVTPVTGYGATDGVITLVKTGGGYPPTAAVGFTASNNASVSVVGFSGTDTEVYALELSQGGANISTGATVLNSIVADINGTSGSTNASTGVTASVITPGSTFAKLFPGYDVLITSTSGISGPSDVLGFDFTALGEQNAANAGITVTAVSAVPEPATAAGAILGAAGLLLGRRKNKAVTV